LRLAAVEVYRNLEEWLLQKKEDDIGKRFRTIAARRAAQGVPLCQLVWVLVISRNHLWHFLQQESFVDNIFELFGELEVHQMLNQFFDRAIYYSILGYDEEVRQDHANRTEREGRFIAGTPGSAWLRAKGRSRSTTDQSFLPSIAFFQGSIRAGNNEATLQDIRA
jgi:hypothetical protein